MPGLGEHGAQQRGGDDLPLARPFAVQQRGADAHRQRDAGREVRHRHTGAHRCAVLAGLLAHHHRAAVGFGDDVAAGQVGPRPGKAEPADLGVDQVRPQGGQGLVAEPQPLRHARPVVVHHHVEARNDAVQQRPPLDGCEVDNEAALAAVEVLEDLALPRRDRAGVAERIALRPFDLHHVRAEVGEVHAGVGAGVDDREVQYANPVERPVRHQTPSASGEAAG